MKEYTSLQRCYRDVTEVLQRRYKVVTRMLQKCYGTGLLRGHRRDERINEPALCGFMVCYFA
jgi:hypothetical protein